MGVVLMSWCALAVASSETSFTLQHEGDARSYRVFAPTSYSEETQTPLLLALHGRPSDAERMQKLSEFNSRAENHGFLVAYPQGKNKFWNYLHGLADNRTPPNDPEFIWRVIDDVKARFNVDDKRVYVAGISNGGFMAQRLACESTEVFAAFASVAATGYAYMPEECATRAAVSMLYIHGTADAKVPWVGLSIPGDSGTSRPVTMSMRDSITYWSNRAGCSPDVRREQVESKQSNPTTHVVRFSSRECVGQNEVMLYAVMGGGHNWPGVEGVIPQRIAGHVNLDIHASDVIWDFFRDKRLQ